MQRLPVAAVLALVVLCGCAQRQNSDLLEARLRVQQDRIAELEADLTRAQEELRVARSESDALRRQIASRGEPVLLPEQSARLFRATGIRISRLMTGSLDRDGRAGDETLATIVTPVDAQGDLVKTPGAIELELLDLSQPAGRQRIGRWSFDAAQTAGQWHQGLIGKGYLFQLPWQQAPRSQTLLLHARMITPDRRQFDTSTEITVDPQQVALSDNPGAKPAGSPALLPQTTRDDDPAAER